MSDSIATAYVTIKPDLSEFRDELRAGLETSDADLTKTVRVDAATGEARAELDELQARIDRLSSESATVKIGTSGSVRRDLTDLQSALDQYRNETLTPNLDPARMEQINRELDGLDGRLRTVAGDLDGTSGSADRLSRSLGTGGGAGAGSGLLGVALAASPALLTMGAVGGGALAAIGVASAAAVTGLGAFGLAAKDNLTAAKTQAETMLQTWRSTTDAFTQPVIAEGLSLIPQALTLATPAVAGASAALQGLERDAQSALGSPFWQKFSTYIGGEGEAAITSFGAAVGGLSHLLAGVAEGLAPEIARIDADFQRWGADMAHFGDQAANGGMTSFINYLQANGPLLAHTLETVGSDFVTIAKDAAPLGPIWLNIANVAAELLGDLEKLNPTLTTWALGVGSVALAVNRLAGPLGGISGLASAAGAAWGLASDAFTVGSAGLYSVATAAGGATGGLVSFLANASALVPGLDLAGAAVLQATGQFNDFNAGIDKAGSKWAQNFIDQLPAGADKIAAVSQEIATLSGSITITQPQFDRIAASTQFFGTALDRLPPSLADIGRALIANGAQPTDTLGEAQKNLGNYMDQVSGQVKALQSALRSLTPAQQAQALAAGKASEAEAEAAGYTGNVALQYGELTTQLKNANQALTQTSTLFNTLLGTELSAAQATTGFYQQVSSLTQSLHANGTALQGTSSAALANQQAFESVGTAITSVIGSMEKQGATSDEIVGKVQSLTAYLEGQAGQYGLTKSQVDNYLHSLGLTPAQVKTDLYLSGYSAAASQVTSIQQQLAALPKNVVTTVTVDYTQIGQMPALGGSGHVTFAHAGGLAPGVLGSHLALVGEKGPERMYGKGWSALVGARGPEVAVVPAGAGILTASETASLPHHADGLAPALPGVIRGPSLAVNINIEGNTDENTVQQIQAVVADEFSGLLSALNQMVGVQ